MIKTRFRVATEGIKRACGRQVTEERRLFVALKAISGALAKIDPEMQQMLRTAVQESIYGELAKAKIPWPVLKPGAAGYVHDFRVVFEHLMTKAAGSEAAFRDELMAASGGRAAIAGIRAQMQSDAADFILAHTDDVEAVASALQGKHVNERSFVTPPGQTPPTSKITGL